jgi:UDP-glucuronate 4-epimerase
MTILITGGAGFVASHLAQRLLEATSASLVLLDNFNDYYDPTLKRQNIRELSRHPRVTVEEADFCDQTVCHSIFKTYHPRHVIHLGASPGVPASLQDPLLYVRNNVDGTTALLEAARRCPLERFLFASSSTVYGLGTEPPFREDKPLGVAASPYGATKQAAELMGFTYHRLYGLPFTSLRLFNVYGPRLRPDLALHIFTRKILEGEPLDLYGDGTVLRDFTHVDDICNGFLAALKAPEVAGEAVNLGHNEPIAVSHLIELIERFAGQQAVINRHPPRAGDMPLTCADLSKAGRLLGYRPQVSIEDGVAQYVEWFRREQARTLSSASPEQASGYAYADVEPNVKKAGGISA